MGLFSETVDTIFDAICEVQPSESMRFLLILQQRQTVK
ncbi:MAG: hypothetical protein JWN25_53 [Verrucomicrobiales bacterium]|nr:hypothetical protein [Verrucomicrobiales bacterium]